MHTLSVNYMPESPTACFYVSDVCNHTVSIPPVVIRVMGELELCIKVSWGKLAANMDKEKKHNLHSQSPITPMDDLESSMNPSCIFLECGRL